MGRGNREVSVLYFFLVLLRVLPCFLPECNPPGPLGTRVMISPTGHIISWSFLFSFRMAVGLAYHHPFSDSRADRLSLGLFKVRVRCTASIFVG